MNTVILVVIVGIGAFLAFMFMFPTWGMGDPTDKALEERQQAKERELENYKASLGESNLDPHHLEVQHRLLKEIEFIKGLRSQRKQNSE